MNDRAGQPVRIFIVTGEHSGDALGGRLMHALRARLPDGVAFSGLGGDAMAAEGLTSIFPLDDVIVMGPLAILKAYPRLRRRALECVAAGIVSDPDIVVVIDAPEFTHPIARRIRKARPDIPIVDYVSPSVWAWRPGRAAKMKPYVDHLLALLPFEPEAHARLGGPPCTYVGHPLIERQDWIAGLDPDELGRRLKLRDDTVKLVVLPGSRSSEVSRLIGPFGDTVGELVRRGRSVEVLIPAVPRQRAAIAEATANWTVPVHMIEGEADKWRAFKIARAALAASGTVTLELAMAGTPMVVAYRVERAAALLRFLVKVPSIVLANLVLGEAVFPEFIQERCTAAEMAPAVDALLDDGPARARQLAALATIHDRMAVADGTTPSERAADIVLSTLAARRAA